MLIVFSTVIITIFIYVTIVFLFSLHSKRNDIADVAWGSGIVLIVIALLWTESEGSVRIFIVSTLVTIWGLRLSLHIARRFAQKTEEDYRYKQMREKWNNSTLQSYLKVFLLQGALMILVSMSVIALFLNEEEGISALNVVGLFLWLIGFSCELLSDKQLKDFVKNPQNKGRIMNKGLWRYSRHPNYFGEVLLWWGVFLVTIGSFSQFGFVLLGAIGPLTITVLILFVSGIPLLEKRYENDSAYQEYARKTNKFFPWIPRR